MVEIGLFNQYSIAKLSKLDETPYKSNKKTYHA